MGHFHETLTCYRYLGHPCCASTIARQYQFLLSFVIMSFVRPATGSSTPLLTARTCGESGMRPPGPAGGSLMEMHTESSMVLPLQITRKAGQNVIQAWTLMLSSGNRISSAA